ncbi:MAG: nucleoside monophosphate kinase [Verrucomicrobia bacterium]|nr:nucleoside monophosphate kinase [Verrucomicrobiota bacterium]
MNKYSIIGPPGAGKSTQAATLAKIHGFVRISVGDIFRWNIKNHTKLGAKIHRFIDSGQLVPDEFVAEVMKARLEQHDWNYGFVLDGYPASQSQAEFFLESYDLDGVILLQVPDEVLTARLANFRVCPACGFDPNLIYDRPRSESVCGLCGAELVTRGSESPAAIQERVREYHTKTEPVVDLLRQRELVVVVDGTRPAQEIHDYIRAELGLTSEAMAQRLRSRIAGAA